MNARLRGGGTLFGGWTVEDGSGDGGEINDCQDELDRGDNPNDLRFCDHGSFPRPLRNEFKLSGTYPVNVPWLGDIRVAGTLQAFPGGAGHRSLGESFYLLKNPFLERIGHPLSAYASPLYTAANCVDPCQLGRAIAPSGQFLTIGNSNADLVIPLLPMNSVKFLPYWTQLDLNVAKVFNIGSWRYDARVEAFNVLNRGVELWHNADTFSPGTSAGVQLAAAFERADSILDGRVIRVAVTARF